MIRHLSVWNLSNYCECSFKPLLRVDILCFQPVYIFSCLCWLGFIYKVCESPSILCFRLKGLSLWRKMAYKQEIVKWPPSQRSVVERTWRQWSCSSRSTNPSRRFRLQTLRRQCTRSTWTLVALGMRTVHLCLLVHTRITQVPQTFPVVSVLVTMDLWRHRRLVELD